MDNHKIYCKRLDKTLTFNQCVSCSKCIPRYILKSIFQTYLHDDKPYPVKVGQIAFRTTELCGNPCIRAMILNRIKKVESIEDIIGIYLMNRGTHNHEWLLHQYYYHDIHVFKEWNIDGTEVVLHGKIDGYDEYDKSILDLKVTEYPPSTNGYSKAYKKNEEQVQIYENLARSMGILKVEELFITYAIFNRCTTDKKEVTLLDYFETYPVEISENILLGKEKIIEMVVKSLNEYKKDNTIILLPKKQAGVYCKKCVWEDICNGAK